MSELSGFDPEHLQSADSAGQQPPDHEIDLTICRGNGTAAAGFDYTGEAPITPSDSRGRPGAVPEDDEQPASTPEVPDEENHKLTPLPGLGKPVVIIDFTPKRDYGSDLTDQLKHDIQHLAEPVTPAEAAFIVPELITEPAGLSEDLRRQIEEPIESFGKVQDGGAIFDEMEARYQRRLAAGEPISDREHELMRSIRLTRLAISNFGPDVPFERKSVNDVIAGYEATKDDPFPLATPTDRLMPGMLLYMRDTHGAQTMGDVATMIRDGSVPRGVVELWVEEGAVGTMSIDAAIVAAYPDLADKVQEAKDRNVASIHQQTERLFGDDFAEDE